MNQIDLQLNFLEGNSIELKYNIKLHKASFSDINKKIGYLKYNNIINMICLSEDDVKSFVTEENISVYTFIVLYVYQSMREKISDYSKLSIIDNNYFIDELIDVLELLFQENVSFNDEYGYFYIGHYGVLCEDNFEEFQSVVKKRNCLENIEEEKENPANEMARQILEKRKKAREKLAKAKANHNGESDNPLTIVDLISIFAEAEHMKLEDVFQYDIYQFNNQFNRMKIFKDYDVNIQALLAGAKSEDIELQHWLSKINNK